MNDKYILTGGQDYILKLWHTQTQSLIHEFNYHIKEIVLSRGLTSKPNIIISSSKDRQLIFYDII